MKAWLLNSAPPVQSLNREAGLMLTGQPLRRLISTWSCIGHTWVSTLLLPTPAAVSTCQSPFYPLVFCSLLCPAPPPHVNDESLKPKEISWLSPFRPESKLFSFYCELFLNCQNSKMDSVHAVKCWNHLLFFWQIEIFPPSCHRCTPSNSHCTPSLLLLWRNVCVWMFVEDSSGWCWWGDYLPPRSLWSAANGTNCTALSLMHWWAFSISVMLSCILPPPLLPSHHLSNHLATCRSNVWLADWMVLDIW